MIDTLVLLRKQLHENPELSGKEHETANRIVEFVKSFNPTQIIEGVGGTGVGVVYQFAESGPTVMIRCELDALPIVEENTFNYRSKNSGVSHKCGHDGHMTIVAGLAPWLKEATFKQGKVVLLFQPAEETGKGAANVIEDSRFKNLTIDYVFALHNLPGSKKHSITVRSGYFTATVQSMCIRLKGKKAHASEPENGVNPALAVSELIKSIAHFSEPNAHKEDFALCTPIYMNLGEKNYGISAEDAEIHYTIRTWSGENMTQLEDKIEKAVNAIAQSYSLQYTIDWFEYFPASNNDDTCVSLIEKVAKQENLYINQHVNSLKFGEDFGWYSQQYKSAIFGLGAGEEHPALHHANYDFPDELIATGIQMFKGMIAEVLDN